MAKKEDQMHIRCETADKKEVMRILREMDVKSDFIIKFFIDNFKDNRSILQFKKEALDDRIIDMTYEIEKLKTKAKLIEDELNKES